MFNNAYNFYDLVAKTPGLARWWGVVVCATPRLGELGRGITIPWRVIAALITAQQPRGRP